MREGTADGGGREGNPSFKSQQGLLVTCVAHVVVEGRPREMRLATGVIGRVWIPAEFALWGGGSVGTKVSGLHRWSGLPAGIVTRFPLAHSLKDVVQPQDVSHFVDHGVGVAVHAVVSGVEDNAAWNCKCRERHSTKGTVGIVITHL